MSAVAGVRIAGTIQLRTAWRALTGWVVGLAAALAGTTFALHASYDTPAKIAAYAEAVRAGDALVAINGRIAGIDTLGGVIADEFGFIAAFALPLMGISLMARFTRHEEETGRAEQVLAGGVGRAAPLAAAFALVLAAVLVVSAAFAGCLAAVGIPMTAATLYAASLGALTLCFAGVAGLAAQAVSHTRAVYAVGLGVLALAYLVRGVGDVLDLWLTWLSPLGWAERTQAFGEPHWWPLAIPVLVAAGCVLVALRFAGQRDVGSALLQGRALDPRASAALTRPFGLALRLSRGTFLGWAGGAVLVAGMFGSLTRQAAEAFGDNPAVRAGLGGAGGSGADILVRLDLVLLALLVAAAAIHGVGVLRAEEASARLDVALSATTTRASWLLARGAALLGGLAVVAVAGVATLSLSTAWSLGSWTAAGRVAAASAAYLPAALVLGGAAFALFGAAPRLFPFAWAWFAGSAFVALLGPALRLPGWVRWLAPTEHVGHLPGGAADVTGVLVLVVVALALVAICVLGFARRDIG